MAGRGEIRRRLRGAAAPALLIGAALYLGYHTVHGERGLLAWMRTKDEVANLRVELAAARTERAQLENRVKRLRPDSLDADLLEERARAVLNLGHRDDLVILEPGAGEP
jgi:cell division protein FtsB